MAKELLKEVERKNISFYLPEDVLIADAFDNNANTKVVSIDNIPSGWMGLDIGPNTIEKFITEIKKSKTIIWNGPMGAFEMSTFAKGTKEVANALAETTESGAITIVGGGDSAAAISDFKLDDNITHISTGGGASLEFLEGKKLPGIESLADK